MTDRTLGPERHVHLLEAISLNYNVFEAALFELYSHHLIVAGLERSECEHFFQNATNRQRLNTIDFIFSKREADRKIVDRVKHLIRYFDLCAEKRNTLMHSSVDLMSLLRASLDERTVQHLYLNKRSKSDWSKSNLLSLSIASLQGIADEIKKGTGFSRDLTFYLQYRDRGLTSFGMLHGLGAMKLESPPTLPDIPPLPRKLKMRMHFRAPRG